MKLLSGVILASLALAGCAQLDIDDGPQRLPVRLDGQPLRGNPVLVQSFETDRIICQGEMQKAGLSGVAMYRGTVAGIMAYADRSNAELDVYEGCMAQRGYAYVRSNEVEAREAQFRANAAAMAASQNQGLATGSIRRP